MVTFMEIDEMEKEAQESRRAALGVEMPAFPVFCVAKPSEEYRVALTKSADKYLITWVEINNNPPSRDVLLTNLNAGKQGDENHLYPFLGSDFATVHEYWEKTLRPAQDSLSLEPFAHDTYLIVDEDCVSALPEPQIGIVTNVPDLDNYNEVDPVFKIMRVPIGKACGWLHALDSLTATPSEIFIMEDYAALCSMPPFNLKEAPAGGKNALVQATRAEARLAKRQALSKNRPTKIGKRVDDKDRKGARVYLASLKEAKRFGVGNRRMEASWRAEDPGIVRTTMKGSETKLEEGFDLYVARQNEDQTELEEEQMDWERQDGKDGEFETGYPAERLQERGIKRKGEDAVPENETQKRIKIEGHD